MAENVLPEAKIIQINAWMGNLMPALLDFIEQEQPGIVCVQEVLTKPESMSRSATFDVHEQLAMLFRYNFFAPTITFPYKEKGEIVTQGNAIYSCWPIEDRRTVFTAGQPNSMGRNDASDYNTRNIQLAAIRLGSGNKITIANHHGFHEQNSLGSPKSVISIERAAAALSEVTGPLLLCGDLNISPESPAMRPLYDLGLHNLSSMYGLETTLSSAHSFHGAVICDYILVNDKIEVRSFTASERIVSDHMPLVLSFDSL